MERYEKYKNSGIEWIGEIPEHWEIKRLKYMGYLYGGLAGKSSNHFNQISNSNNKPFIPFTNICNNIVIDPNQMQYVVIEDGEKQNKVQEGDLFFMMSSENFDDVGKSSILLHDLGETYLNSFCKGFRFTNDSYYPSFINYLLLSKPFRSLVLTEANGYTRINLKIDKINDIPVIYPTNLEEQTTIATYLDRKTTEIDRIIANKQKLIALYEEEKQAIINQAVTKGVKTHGVRLKDSGVEWLGEIPEHWEVKKLKYLVAKIGSGVTPTGGSNVYQTSGIPLLRSQNIYFDGLHLDDVAFISEEIDESMSNSRINERDILLNITGGSIGRCYYVSEGFGPGNVNQHVCILRPILQRINYIFLYFLLRSNIGQLQIDFQQTGANREGLNFEQLKNFIIPLMDINEQQSIVAHIEKECSRLNSIIAKFNKQIDLLKEYRTTLISEVVTGKIMVTENENK